MSTFPVWCIYVEQPIVFILVRIHYTSIAVALSDMILHTRHTLYCTAQNTELHSRYSFGKLRPGKAREHGQQAVTEAQIQLRLATQELSGADAKWAVV